MDNLPTLPMEHPAKRDIDQIFRRLLVYNERDYQSLSRRDRFVWDVTWMDSALMNGGRDAWFTLMGHHAVETLEALRAIDAPNAYRVIERACELFPDLPPRADESLVHKLYDEFVERHGMIDDHLADEAEQEGRVEADVELDLYQRLLDYWHSADPDVN